jgi:hypothetical protein
MLVKITLAEIEIDQLLFNQETYLIRVIDMAKYQFDEIAKSKRAEWLKSNGAILEHIRVEDINTTVLKEVLYAVIDEKLATEYYLRF